MRLSFSRKVSVRSIGDNTRRDVEAYIGRQVAKEQFADARHQWLMEQFTIEDPNVDLSQPTPSTHGRYWYNLHVVLVTDERQRLHDEGSLSSLRDSTLRIAAKKSHRISRLAVMPDHLHMAIRPAIDESPVDVIFAYQNNLAYMLNAGQLWRDSYYAGTFSEYTTHVAHRCAQTDGARGDS